MLQRQHSRPTHPKDHKGSRESNDGMSPPRPSLGKRILEVNVVSASMAAAIAAARNALGGVHRFVVVEVAAACSVVSAGFFTDTCCRSKITKGTDGASFSKAL